VLFSIAAARYASAPSHALFLDIVLIVSYLVIGLTSTRPHLREAMQRYIQAIYEKHRSLGSASVISSLMGERSPEEVLRNARERFRTITLDRIDQKELANSRPDPDLYRRSVPAVLGQCDAFVSHSWHDDAELKWAALQAWRNDFVRQHHREPTVWIDKCKQRRRPACAPHVKASSLRAARQSTPRRADLLSCCAQAASIRRTSMPT